MITVTCYWKNANITRIFSAVSVTVTKGSPGGGVHVVLVGCPEQPNGFGCSSCSIK